MATNVGESEASVLVEAHHAADEGERAGGDGWPWFVLWAPGGFDEFEVFVGAGGGLVPGGVACEEDEEDDGRGPDVDAVAAVGSFEDFGGDVGGRADEAVGGAVLAFVLVNHRKAKVGDFKVAVAVDENVLGLEIWGFRSACVCAAKRAALPRCAMPSPWI